VVVVSFAVLDIERGRAGGARRGRVCIVTYPALCCNPRVLKEADALAEAGYAVRVIGTQHAAWQIDWDRRLADGRNWEYEPVTWAACGVWPRARRYWTGARQYAACGVTRLSGLRSPLAELANSRLYFEQLRRVVRGPADLIIAHYVPALAVAAAAARRRGVPFAFDAEDDHFGEFAAAAQESLPARLVRHLEAKYLRRCAFVTAASEGIAQALADRYGITPPTAVHNVFSWSERSRLDRAVRDRRGPALSLIWYSQVVGLNRGIQDAIRAAGLVKGEVQLHIRGRLDEITRAQLTALARDCGVHERLHFHATVHPDELLSRVSEHDIGLALEQPVNANKSHTCSNKSFFYLLAGLAVAATDVPGQRAILNTCPEAAFLYPPGDYRALAAHLQRLADSPALLQRAKQAALAAAQDRWTWEHEGRKVVALVEGALATAPR
jgi:glycosyltransferase involved in cell wall biosynthesis